MHPGYTPPTAPPPPSPAPTQPLVRIKVTRKWRQGRHAILRHPFLLVQAWSEGQEEAWVQEVPYNPRQRKRKYRVINLTVEDPPEIN